MPNSPNQASISLPALSKAKDHAKKIHCSTNLKSLSLAAMMYADANDGRTPSSTNQWDSSTKAGWCGVTFDFSTLEPLPLNEQIYGNSDPTTGLQRGQLWFYIETSEAWRCPANPLKKELRSYCKAAQWWGIHACIETSQDQRQS